jgi:hypothetical protein
VLVALTVAAAIAGSAQNPLALAGPSTASLTSMLASISPPAPDVSAQAAASWQTDGTVWAIAYARNRVFIGGQFINVRPPGAAPRTRQQSRTFLAEFNSRTGALIEAFHPTLRGPKGSGGVYALAVSPDGRTLYAGGLFGRANGRNRENLAAFSTSTGRLTSWAPRAFGKVNAIAVSPNGSTIYLGGSFQELGTPGTAGGLQARTYAGAVDASGKVQPWAPVLNNAVTSVALATVGSLVDQVLIGGYFQTINGVPQNAAGAVDPTAGSTSEPWSAGIVPYQPGVCTSAVKAIVISGGTAYLGAEGTGAGCFDGDFAVSLSSTGDQLLWQNDCLGATQALAVIDGYLFKGSHAHDCAFAPGGFPQHPEIRTGPWATYHLLDQSLKDGSLGHFTPSTNATLLGPRAMATDGRQLFVGGDFTTVNGKPQQGFARFGQGADPARPPSPGRPSVTSSWRGAATVTFTAVSTPDVGRLRYTIFEVGRKAPLGSMTATSWPWALPVLHYHAAGLKPRAKLAFFVTASDGIRTSARSAASAPVAVAGSNPRGSYLKAILAAKPSFFWPLDEGSGNAALDATPHHLNGSYEPGVTPGAPGPISTSKATVASFNGTTGIVTSDTSQQSPSSFSIGVWFRTSANTGGQIAGFGNAQTGLSTQYDRQIYLMNDGQLVFGVLHGSAREIIETPNVYNDGRWHAVVATFNSAARSDEMALYVDGVLIGVKMVGTPLSYSGYWRVGGGNLIGWSLDAWRGNSQGTTEPNSFYLRGSAGDFAVYPYALSVREVAAQYALAGP